MNKLDRAYQMIPKLNCKGLCHESCGPVFPSYAEIERIQAQHGVQVDFNRATLTCTLLKDHRCSIYQDRPLLCRLWGAVDAMPCVFGCEPEGGVMRERDEHKVMQLVYGKKKD